MAKGKGDVPQFHSSYLIVTSYASKLADEKCPSLRETVCRAFLLKIASIRLATPDG